jgi:hypothetical protein
MRKIDIEWSQVLVGLIIGFVIAWFYLSIQQTQVSRYQDVLAYNAMINELNSFCASKVPGSIWNGIIRGGLVNEKWTVSVGCGSEFGNSAGAYYFFDYRLNQ